MKSGFPIRCRSTAFTLLDAMLAVGLLSVMVVFVTQMVGGVGTTITASGKHMSAESQARMIFDRMAADFGKMVQRSDVDYCFLKQTDNDRFFFYSEAPAYSDSGTNTTSKSPVGLIGYQINSQLQLERLGMQLDWEGTPNETATPPVAGSMACVVVTGSNTVDTQTTIAGRWPKTLNADSSSVNDFHVIGDQVYRMEFCFLLKDGTWSDNPYLPSSSVKRFCIKDVAGISVTLALLDTGSRIITKDTTRMVSALPDVDAATNTGSIAKAWMQSAYLTQSGIPKAAASNIRIYQRCFYLNHP
ncbi:MAG: type II secretion system protein J [Chthoniobacteraceae bacterium]